ncbi:lysophospholipase [Candidatus Methanoperedens nitroreducens]|uniref:Lysophospholipase n=2 Tax=Candidatus Methanoperedens nitratireducens TaxID=1392998 RepID=A0A062V784_9EURY|nr:lysophospholipase [Candidatus Methanoperedens nitroreducens]
MKETYIEAADKHSVRNVLVDAGSDNLVILAHGITSEKNEDGIYTRFAENILFPDFDSIRFDFRGHGDSQRSPIEMRVSGEILDLMAVIAWAKQHYKRIHLVATSFGASITLLSSSIFDFNFLLSVTMWNPVISYRNTFINSTVSWGKEFFNQSSIEELAYRPYTKISESEFFIGSELTIEFLLLHPEKVVWPEKIPLLIIHGTGDTVVPYKDTVSFSKQNKNVLLHTIPKVDHGFDEKIEEVYEVTKKWINKFC